jgi:hypothetical protein
MQMAIIIPLEMSRRSRMARKSRGIQEAGREALLASMAPPLLMCTQMLVWWSLWSMWLPWPPNRMTDLPEDSSSL